MPAKTTAAKPADANPLTAVAENRRLVIEALRATGAPVDRSSIAKLAGLTDTIADIHLAALAKDGIVERIDQRRGRAALWQLVGNVCHLHTAAPADTDGEPGDGTPAPEPEDTQAAAELVIGATPTAPSPDLRAAITEMVSAVAAGEAPVVAEVVVTLPTPEQEGDATEVDTEQAPNRLIGLTAEMIDYASEARSAAASGETPRDPDSPLECAIQRSAESTAARVVELKTEIQRLRGRHAAAVLLARNAVEMLGRDLDEAAEAIASAANILADVR